ncbi:MAG: LysM peptidoglycan-binding domain-containing protein [Rhodocyclaceae bacterium]|nr:LysM peptidoglycan-binding domain-containing protein [Rhodocyclaceae bacterium]
MTRIISALLLALAAGLAQAAAPAPLQVADDAPNRHVVVPGDTLWGISARFLKEPWRWPEIWRLNREQIRNPHLIYPGDVILLERDADGTPQLRLISEGWLRPKAYSEALTQTVPSIPPNVIEPFISEPLIVDEGGIADSARIVAMQEDRVFLGAGDTAFVAGAGDRPQQETWQIYRPAQPLLDPETREVLGHEAFYLGTARQVQPGEPGVFTIATAKQEIGRGDRLLPAKRPQLVNYAPHRPERTVDGRVASVYGGVGTAGRNSVITLNRGRRDGLEVGHVLALHRNRSDTFRNDETGRMETVRLPDQRYGLVFVFRTFERVAYALVLSAAGTVNVNDLLRQP